MTIRDACVLKMFLKQSIDHGNRKMIRCLNELLNYFGHSNWHRGKTPWKKVILSIRILREKLERKIQKQTRVAIKDLWENKLIVILRNLFE